MNAVVLLECLTLPAHLIKTSTPRTTLTSRNDKFFLSHRDDISKSVTTEYIRQLTKSKNLQIAVTSISSLVEKTDGYKCNENRPFYLLLSNDVATQEALRKISRSMFSGGRWLQFFSIDMALDDFFRDVFVPYDCEFTVVQRAEDKLILTEVYRHLHQIMQKHVVATSENHGFLWTNLTMLKRRNDLQGVTIRVGVVKEEADAIKAKCKNMEKRDFCRLLMEIWTTIENESNFVSEYVTFDNTNNYVSGNGTWGGIIALVLSDQVDVGLAKYGITTERRAVINFISMAFHEKITTFIKKNGGVESHWHHILEPFSTGFWWTVLLSLVILILSLSKIWYFSMRYGFSQGIENYSLYNCWMYIYGSFCQQGHDTTPVAWSCRIVYLTAYLTGLVLFTSYSAVYISMLAVQHDSLPFSDYRGLIDIGTYDFGVIAASLYLNIFEKATDPLFQEVHQKMLVPNLKSLPADDKEGFRKVCEQGNYAFTIGFSSTYNKAFPCELVEIPRASFLLPASFIISKSSPYHRIFSHNLENLRRTGILKRIKMLQIPFKPEDVTLPHLEASMEDTVAIFAILVGGVAVAILCLVAEYLYFFISRCYKNVNIRYNASFYN